VNIPGYTIIRALAYQGKKGCGSPVCTRYYSAEGVPSGDCIGYHCSYCDEPCGPQGHRCDASEEAHEGLTGRGHARQQKTAGDLGTRLEADKTAAHLAPPRPVSPSGKDAT